MGPGLAPSVAGELSFTDKRWRQCPDNRVNRFVELGGVMQSISSRMDTHACSLVIDPRRFYGAWITSVHL